MKSVLKVTLIVLILMVFFVGCQNKQTLTGPQPTAKGPHNSIQTMSLADNKTVGYPLIAGQHTNVGQVIVSNDAINLYITFSLTGGWKLTESHVHIANSLNGIPHNKNGIPIPGHFAYSATHNPAVTQYMYQIPLSIYSFVTGDTLYIATHAVVVNGDYPDGSFQEETAWGGNIS